ncbi:MAG TPA: M48 family metalloprotease [SAR86 cluster bacterium]|jgi:predicted Zn-dependent protease|nr:M48 family metalloprotease [SAR86 cluster bacterium]HJM15536.1 M48 family metalloprotease [SAR86 cluster bacterium]
MSRINISIFSLLLTVVISLELYSEEEKLPVLGDASSSAISIASEYNLGRLYMAQLRRSIPEYSDPVTQDYAEHLVYRLAEYSELRDRRLEIALIDEKSINAFAAPGGIIGINAGLIFHSNTEGELASVLSHELAHLSQRHFARRMQRQKDRSLANSLMILASVALAGATSNPNAILAGQQAITQQALSFSRGDEQEADRIGFKNLISAGFDPFSMSYMFEKLQSLSRLSGSNELEFLRSHPLTKKRISDAQSRAREFEGSNYRNALEYELVKARSVVHFAQLPRQAIRQFDQGLRRAKSNKESLIAEYGLALAHSKNNDHEDALQFMRNSLNKDKDNLLIQIGILEVHIAAANYFEAEALAVSLLQLNPNNYPISMLYNRILMNKGDYEKGEEVLRILTLKRPSDPQIWYWLAEVQGLDKNIIGLHLSRAEYFYLTGSYETSLKHLRMALELVGNNFQLTETIHNKIERSHKSIEALKST